MLNLPKRAAAVLAASALASCAGPSTGPGMPYVFAPSGKGPYPGVLVLHTSGGVLPHVVDFARLLSDRRYVTVVVDFHARGGADNIEKAYDTLVNDPLVRSDRIGVVGFSRGAMEGIRIAEWSHRFSERRIGAIVSYYIGPQPGNTSEHLPPILFLHGSLDVHVGPERIRRFCEIQVRDGRVCEAEIYDNVLHAFDHRSRDYNGFDPVVTQEAFTRAVGFLDKYLKDL